MRDKSPEMERGAAGWVKLHRKLLESAVFQSEGLLKCWIYCMTKASYKRHWVSMRTGRGTTEVEIHPGQFIFGRNEAARELRMKPSTVEGRFRKLMKLGNIDMQSDTHWRIVTINKWATYQDGSEDIRQATRQPTDRQPTGNRQPTDTYKKDQTAKNSRKAKNLGENFDQMCAVVEEDARKIFKTIPPKSRADKLTVITACLLKEKLCEDWLWDSVEGVKRTTNKNPVAYFRACLDERATELGFPYRVLEKEGEGVATQVLDQMEEFET